MAAIYSVAFFSGDIDAGDPTIDYTCPDGFVAVLRAVDVFITGLLGPANCILFDTGTGSTFWQALASPPPIQQSFKWRGRQVFEAGNGFTLQRGDGTWGTRASGYLLSAP